MINKAPLENLKPLTIWTITSGAAGMRSQTEGLANAVANIRKTQQPSDNSQNIITTDKIVTTDNIVTIVEKIIGLKSWARPFPGHLNPAPFKSLTRESSQLKAPWPDIILSCGRRSSAISIAIGKRARAETKHQGAIKPFRVHIQNPQTPTSYFDLVASMQHDSLTGKNVVNTKVALQKLTSQQLANEKHKWQTIWQKNFNLNGNQPILGITLGGKNKQFGFDEERLNNLISVITKARSDNNALILITPSNRTEEFVKTALNQHFNNDPSIWIWDQQGDNPYLGILANSDHLLITADSVSMISEGLFTTKPVHIFPLNGTSRRHKIFIDILSSDNLIHRVEKTINFSVKARPTPIDETTRIAHIILEKLQQAE